VTKPRRSLLNEILARVDVFDDAIRFTVAGSAFIGWLRERRDGIEPPENAVRQDAEFSFQVACRFAGRVVARNYS
jgi:hypothetical protein